MREIIAIDPGPTESAWCIYGGSGAPLYVGKEPNDAVLGRFVLNGGREIAIEMIASYGMAVGREVFETCLWVGRMTQAFIPMAAGREVRLVYRAEVKMHLCHSMKAKDANIRQALIDKFGPPGTKKNKGKTYGISGDCWAALGVAVTAMETPAPPENMRR